VSAVDSMGHAVGCSQASVAGSSEMCCLGTARPLNQNAYPHLPFVAVINDQTLIKRSCQALGVSECDFTSEKVYLDCGEIKDGIIKCTDPSPIEVPAFAFKFPEYRIVKFALTIAEARATTITWPTVKPQIFPVTYSAKQGLAGMYLFTMHVVETGRGADPWVPMMKNRWDFWSKKDEGILVLASNVPTPLELLCNDINLTADGTAQCSGQDDCVVWANKEGDNCTTYEEEGWCVGDDIATANFTAAYPCSDGKGDLYAPCVQSPGIAWGAPKPCCACGGGSFGGNETTVPDNLAKVGAYVTSK